MTASTRPSFEEGTETIFGWVQEHWRSIMGGALVIAALAGGFALYDRNQTQKESRGERALLDAQRAALSGNLPLAQSDLEKVRVRYQGTAAADRAAVTLAQVLYDQGKYADGVKVLQPVTRSKTVGASAEALLATGLEEQNRPKEAAEHYKKAAALSVFEIDKANFMASAARAYARGGDTTAAKSIWTDLASDPEGPVAGEARVRLGELTAMPVTRS